MYGIDRHGKNGSKSADSKKLNRSRIGIVTTFVVLSLLSCSMIFMNTASAASLPQISVTVNAGVVVGTNSLSLGFNAGLLWQSFVDSSHQQQLARDTGVKLVQIWDKNIGPSDYSLGVGPCISWNDATKTGKFDWTTVDATVKLIISIGAQPMFTLSKWRPKNDVNGWPSVFPPGMAMDPNTLLPNPQSYAAFVAAWVQHFKDVGLPVKYYEIFNEPQTYFGWAPPGNVTRIANFVNLFNAVYTRVHQINPNVMVSTDASLERQFFSYFLNYGVGIDYLDFHKYDAWNYPQYSDAQMLTFAEQKYVSSTPYDYTAYSIAEARQAWFSKHGNILPAILSEGNWNAACAGTGTGTDPKVQQMVGAVRTALVARMGMLDGMSYDVYYCWSSSLRSESRWPSGGAGYGLINNDNEAPWYPYYLLQMIGTSLSPNDQIVQSSVSDNTNFRTIAWKHSGQVYVMVINKSPQSYQIKITGLQGTVNYSKIDQSIPWQTPKLQKGQLGDYLTCTGYTVALIQGNASSDPPASSLFQDGFESGSFSAWTSTSVSSGETAKIVNTLPNQGIYSAKFSSDGSSGSEYSYCYEKVVPSSELYARGYFYVSQAGVAQNDDRFYFIVFSTGTGNVAYAGWRETGGVTKWTLLIKSGTTAAVAFSTSSPSLNHWYSVELHWKEDAAIGQGDLWVDGVKVCSLTSKNTTAYGDVTQVRFGLPASFYCGATTVYCDDCAISNKSF